jgi:hypothetical protein
MNARASERCFPPLSKESHAETRNFVLGSNRLLYAELVLTNLATRCGFTVDFKY